MATLIIDEQFVGNTQAYYEGRGWYDGTNGVNQCYILENDATLNKQVIYARWVNFTSQPASNGGTVTEGFAWRFMRDRNNVSLGWPLGVSFYAAVKFHKWIDVPTNGNLGHGMFRLAQNIPGQFTALNSNGQITFESGRAAGTTEWYLGAPSAGQQCNPSSTPGNTSDPEVKCNNNFYIVWAYSPTAPAFRTAIDPCLNGFAHDDIWYEIAGFVLPSQEAGQAGNTGKIKLYYRQYGTSTWIKLFDKTGLNIQDGVNGGPLNLVTCCTPYAHNNLSGRGLADMRQYLGWITYYEGDAITSGQIPGFSNPPVITWNVTPVTVNSSNVTFTWSTDIPSSTQVHTGKTNTYGIDSINDASLVTVHSPTIARSALTPGTYFYQGDSKDASNNLITSNNAGATYVIPTNTFYVSPSGSNSNPGTITQPWLTIEKAFQAAVAGDIVYFRAGTYTPTGTVSGHETPNLIPTNSGTSNTNRIIFKAMDGEIVTIGSNSGGLNHNSIGIDNKNYITFSGFIISVTQKIVGVVIKKSIGITIENCEIIGDNYTGSTEHFGIYVIDQGAVKPVNTIIRNCKIHGLKYTNTDAGKLNNTGIMAFHPVDFLVENCEIYDCVTGISTKEAGLRQIYRYNKFYNHLSTAFRLGTQGPNPQEDIKFYQNICIDNNFLFNAQASGSLTKNVRIYNNILSRVDEIQQVGQGEAVEMWNNIFVQTTESTNYVIEAEPGAGGVVTFSDYNDFFRNPAKPTMQWEYDGNNSYTTLASVRANTIFEDFSIEANPLFVNQGVDYHLQSGSPCINAGLKRYEQGTGTTTIGPYITGTETIGLLQPPGPIPIITSGPTSGSITSNSAIITWTTDQNTTSRVNYGLTTSYGSNVSLDDVFGSGTGTDHKVTLTGLTGAQTYHFNVVSTNSANQSVTSGDFSFLTSPGGPSPLIFEEYWTDTNSPTGQVAASQANLIARSWILTSGNIGLGYRFELDSILNKQVLYAIWSGQAPTGSDAKQPNGSDALQRQFATSLTQAGATFHVAVKFHNILPPNITSTTGDGGHFLRMLQNWSGAGGFGPNPNQLNIEVFGPNGGNGPFTTLGNLGHGVNTAPNAFVFAGGTFGSYSGWVNPSPLNYLLDDTWYEIRCHMFPQIVSGGTGRVLCDYKKTTDTNWTRIIDYSGQPLTDTTGYITQWALGPYHTANTTDDRMYVGFVKVYQGDAITNGTITGGIGGSPNPPVISGQTETNISTTTATINWTTDLVATSRVDYGTDTNYGSNVGVDDVFSTGTGATHKVSISGLAPNTNYHYKVTSTNLSSLTSESPDKTFLTQPSQSVLSTVKFSLDYVFVGD